MPAVELDEKHLERGPSSSISGQMIKVMYSVQFELVYDKKSNIISLPLTIMTPNINAIYPIKPTRDEHPEWNPYIFNEKELNVSNTNEFYEA